MVEPQDGRAWALRFRAYGKRRYITLGTAEDDWNRQRAEAELRHASPTSSGAPGSRMSPSPSRHHRGSRPSTSSLLAARADVPYVMCQVGHTDPKMTLGIYAQVIDSMTDHGAALDGLVEAHHWAATGSESPEQDFLGSVPPVARTQKTPP